MTGKQRQSSFAIALAVFTLFTVAPSIFAGTLDGHADAYDDGNGPSAGAWTGSVAYANFGLSGTIDFSVFTAADFNTNFPGAGYVPGDSLVYTYQVNNTGTAAVSAEIVGISNPANTIGTFDLGGGGDVNATSASFTPNAQWLFAPELPGGGNSSYGLAFSSPRAPMTGASLTLDSGLSFLASGLPTPGPVGIPEPTSLALIVLGAGAMLMSGGRKSRC